jgi:hypothetical protein
LKFYLAAVACRQAGLTPFSAVFSMAHFYFRQRREDLQRRNLALVFVAAFASLREIPFNLIK